ncbi:patatin-like phospholipase family protein [Massilia sp. YIM B02443]|uniref:patatin-like phospholipase family protein n=1 Tax=Massilia sp. YIM B02443 TaxID=3050127 RepID=UPI0025B69A83|nr:patatin-like phospholipase family protein [Massilia sp. YIM B02443]
MTTFKTISLALQGGGTYGAFGWGVLDRLLQQDDLALDALSGSSAGAINAVVVADGYARGGGRAGARKALDKFWRALGSTATLSPLQRTPLDRMAPTFTMEFSPVYHLLELAGALAGPVREGPVTLNPLRHFLSATIDFERVRDCEELQLIIAATNVRTGMGKLFRREEMDVQRLVASACLPTVFAAVEVEGEMYWDGSYVANPPLAPLLEHSAAGDLIIVQNNPIARSDMPRTMADIANRANEIAFNISFIREVSALQYLNGVPEESRGAGMMPNTMRLHLISGNEQLQDHGISAKFNAEMPFLQMLHDQGFAAADRWLKEQGGNVGVKSTLDIQPVFFADQR